MTNDKTPVEARKLNMEEKRKLEKILLADVDVAIGQYQAKRNEQKAKLKEAMLAKPPKAAVQLLAAYNEAKDCLKEAEAQLEKIGYRPDSTQGKFYRLALYWGDTTKELRAFDALTSRTERALTSLKRTYTLKLFAGGQEAQELFALLAAELSSIGNN